MINKFFTEREMEEIPSEIRVSAMKIERWMKEQGCDEWEFMGIQSRRCSQWQPIETAPVGKFLVWIPSTNLPWPASRYDADSEVFSNSHGVLNREDDRWSPKATHWMQLPEIPKQSNA